MLGVKDIVKELTIAYEQTQENQKMISKKEDEPIKLAKLKYKEEEIIMIKREKTLPGQYQTS